ncbi:MAG: hypothetical protein LBI48_03640 [Burkholderiaceae bacterium]|jgi:prepilin signal peptidase PulO-like enzyme (type II secretory pathway)|nr:hypothetical protein [Burkholderiaceae bacterium]
MPVISSRSTLLFYKYLVLPLLWLLFIAALLRIGPIVQWQFPFLAIMLSLAVAMSALYFWPFRRLMKPFADEVRDAGDALIVRKSGDQAHIPLAGIANMETRIIGRGQMYYLFTLRAPCPFGNEVAFFPVNNGSRFLDGTPWRSRRALIYDDLIERIGQAHR